jgi:hypothetical protein
MAHISNVQLEVGRSGSNEFARIRFRVTFSASERSLNIPFLVYADLYERDDALDTYIAHDPNLFAAQLPRGNRDDLIGEIARRIIRPDGNPHVDLDVRRDFLFAAIVGTVHITLASKLLFNLKTLIETGFHG